MNNKGPFSTFCAAVLAGPALCGCLSAWPAAPSPKPREPAPLEAEGALFDRYPAPVDPTLLPPRTAAPIPEPKVILHKEGKKTLVYTCAHTQSEHLKKALEGLVGPEGSIQASVPLNALIITDTAAIVDVLLELAKALDHPVPQLLVEARVVEITLDSDLEIELRHFLTHPGPAEGQFVRDSEARLDTPGATPATTQGLRLTVRPISEDNLRLETFFRALLTQGKAKILSSPNVIVSSGEEASIITGEEVPFQTSTVVSGSVSTTTQFKRVGIKLRVKPLQITNDTAHVEINPEVSAVTGFTTSGEGVSNPIVAIRNVSTVLSLKDGEILTIGGLLRGEDREVIRKVPLLGDIPILGALFRSRRTQNVKTQLVFFLRVNLLDEGKPHTIRLHRPGEGLKDLDGKMEGEAPADGEKTPAVPDPAPAPGPAPPGK